MDGSGDGEAPADQSEISSDAEVESRPQGGPAERKAVSRGTAFSDGLGLPGETFGSTLRGSGLNEDTYVFLLGSRSASLLVGNHKTTLWITSACTQHNSS